MQLPITVAWETSEYDLTV